MSVMAIRPGDMELVEQLRATYSHWLSERPSVRAVRTALDNCRAEKAQRILDLFYSEGSGTATVPTVPLPPPAAILKPVPAAVPLQPVRVPVQEPRTTDPVPPVRNEDVPPVPRTTTAVPEQGPVPEGVPVKRSLAYRLEEVIGCVPPLASLTVAAVLQTQLAHQKLDWGMWYAWLPAAAIEGGTVYLAALRTRHIEEGDSTALLTVGLMGFVSLSCALVSYHVYDIKAPIQVAVAMGLMAAMSAFLWARRDSWKRRVAMRIRGLIRPRPMAEAAIPQFSATRWMVSPLQTASAFRYAVKNSISDTEQAMSAYKAHKIARKVTRKSRKS